MPRRVLAAGLATLWDSRQDLIVLVGLLLWAAGWWTASITVALIGPALILLWYALPSRPPFIVRNEKDRT